MLLIRYASFDLELSSAALLGVGQRGGSYYRKLYTWFLERLASAQFGFVYFYKVYSNTFDICLHWILSHVQSGHLPEGLDPFLSVFLFLNVSGVFGGGSEVVSKYFQ